MLDIWFTREFPDLPPCLNREERGRSERFLRGVDRRTFVQAHTFKRLLISHYDPATAPGDWRFVNSSYGKPGIAPSHRCHFNLSHSGPCLAVALADFPVGVDIERQREMKDVEVLAREVFHPGEREWLVAQPCFLTAFFRLWTVKEAILKAVGTGFSTPPDSFCCEVSSGEFASANVAGSRWHCWSRSGGDFHLSVAAAVQPLSGPRYFQVHGAPVARSVSPSAVCHPSVSRLLRYASSADCCCCR
ncbi:4'-phosphopantetheinyl transferase family protein [Microbulbifer halophilus]|uniref:4'-phosphopantetheinyl transferase family protein n=2 Tax=Microbulbifer halophilus TaxID=453963 RepID=A0ABW5E6R0_9GAMM|nr:4'-phosphopantetheinyl transferase superfamily protein [Microbulbifer halophilus]MCW8127256.1 4'-phosphopantetheinyl transferase superfamily protein [Microbulbifer halophilus]